MKTVTASALVVLLSLLCFGSSDARVVEKELANGLKVIMEPSRSSHAVSVQVWYRAGSSRDSVDTRGIASFVGKMMFRGTASYPDREFERIINAIGGRTGSSLFEDGVGFYEIVPSRYLERVLSMEADRMQNLAFEHYHVEEVRSSLLEEIVSLTRSPVTGAISEIAKAAFGMRGYGLPLSGHPLDLANISRDQLIGFYRKYYVPNNAALVLTGDFEPKKALSLVKKYFGEIPPHPVPDDAQAFLPPERPSERLVVKKPKALPLVMFGFPAASATDEDSPALLVLAHILLKRNTPVLTEVLTGSAKPALSAGGDYAPRRHSTLFWFFAVLKQASTHEEVEGAMWAVIDSLKAGGITEHDVKKARHNLIARNYIDQEELLDRGKELGQAELFSSWRSRDDYARRIESVKLSDVDRVLKKYITRENAITAWLVGKEAPEEKANEEAQ